MKKEDETKAMWQELSVLSHDELFKLLVAYDDYVYEIVNDCESVPVGVPEFYKYEYKEFAKGE